MNVSREQVDKLIVGGGDVSFPDGGPDVSPTGTAVLNGPVYVGKPTASPVYEANLNVASNGVTQSTFDRQPKYQSNLAIKADGNVKVDGDSKTANALDVTGNTLTTGDAVITGDATIQGTTFASVQGTINVQGWKGFDIKHPTKEGYRLRYICLEGPEGGVYHRGRITGTNVINLPDYWKDLVDTDSITVQLQPIGRQQNLVIQEIDEDFIVIVEDSTNIAVSYTHLTLPTIYSV